MSVQDGQVVARFEIERENDDPLTEIGVLVNGRPIPGARRLARTEPRIGADDARRISREVTVPLVTGTNRLQVVAETRYARSIPGVVSVIREVADAQPGSIPDTLKPRLFVLAVGVSSYANPGYDLDFAEQAGKDGSAQSG